MSRTDVHRPWQVQLADPHNRHLLYRYPAWPWQVEWASYRNLGCGCHLCTGQPGRKRARRQERQGTRRQLHDVSAQWAAGELDEDAPYPHQANAW
jgi:hypothetical protein